MSLMYMAAGAPPAPSASEVVIKTGYYLGVSVAAGVGLALLVLTVGTGVVGTRIRKLAVPVAGLVVVTALAQFAEAVADAEGTGFWGGFGPGAISRYIDAPAQHGPSGAVAGVQMLFYAALVVALLGVWLRGTRAVAAVAFVLAVATAVVPNVPTSSVKVDDAADDVLTSVHVAGVEIWVGGLFVLAAAGLIGARRRGLQSADEVQVTTEWAQIWHRYSTAALVAVGMIVVSGSWLAWVHVGTPVQLVTTSYGRYLGIKLILVALMLGAGAYNTRKLLPQIRAAQAAGDGDGAFRIAVQRFPGTVAVESLLALGVLFIVPFFAGSARREAGWANARSFDWTVFGTGAILAALVVAVLWAGTRTRSVDADARPVEQSVS